MYRKTAKILFTISVGVATLTGTASAQNSPGSVALDASLRGADLTGARLSAVNLAGADLFDVRGWREIATVAHANVAELRTAPRGFVEWALLNGAAGGASDGSVDNPEQSREFRIL